MSAPTTMRDAFIGALAARMDDDPAIFFLTADLGAPALDGLRGRHPARCINVGIAEQNLLEVATGLAVEGMAAFAYAIAPFITMRAYEQARVAAILHRTRPLNLNLIGLGAGFSYDVSGPTHQCVEDLTLMRLLPDLEVFSPSDPALARAYTARALSLRRPKYLRLDGKALPDLADDGPPDFARGFRTLRRGRGVCLVATGYPVHTALEVHAALAADGEAPGVVDVFQLSSPDRDALAAELSPYRHVFTLEEAFVRRGGLDALVADLILERGLPAALRRYGPDGRYALENGSRADIHRLCGMDPATVARDIRALGVAGRP